MMFDGINNAAKHSLFLNTENDMKFNQKNLDYWIEAKEKLQDSKLVPSFMPVECRNIRPGSLVVNHFGG
jgi:hypothetical protein